MISLILSALLVAAVNITIYRLVCRSEDNERNTRDGELKQRFLSLIVTVFALSMILDGMGFHDVFRFLESATRHGIIEAFQRVSERKKANEYSGSVHDFRQTKKGKR